MWTFSRIIASLLTALIVVIHNRLTFTGDVGTVMMWLSEGLADDIVAVLAAITLVWVIETRKPAAWVGGLATLYLYSGGLNAWRILKRGWHVPPRTPDYIGILIQAIIPAGVSHCWCLVDETFRRAKSYRHLIVAKSPSTKLSIPLVCLANNRRTLVRTPLSCDLGFA